LKVEEKTCDKVQTWRSCQFEYSQLSQPPNALMLERIGNHDILSMITYATTYHM
jgi:hypothetical protein